MPRSFERYGVWLKTCPHCHETKTLDGFADNRTTFDKKEYWCRQCREVPIKNAKRARQLEDGTWVKECARCHEIKETDQFTAYVKNHDGFASYCHACSVLCTQESRARNLTKARRRDVAYNRRRKESDPNHRLLVTLRDRVRRVITRKDKSAPTRVLMGCLVDEFRQHLERLFEPGMAWSNHGKEEGQWSIDHVLPCVLFDMTQASHQRACFGVGNSQPMWHYANVIKQDRLDDGRRARDLTPDEKKAYLMSHGYAHLFESPDS